MRGWLPASIVGALLWLGCAEEEPPASLQLDGPARVRVERLGPVDAPQAIRSDGGAPVDVSWSAAPDSVARVEGGQVVAVGPGEAKITGRAGEQRVEWTLVVEPTVALHLVDPPARVPIGRATPLVVEGRIDDRSVPAGPVTWSSSDPAVATVDPQGNVLGIAPGIVYVTARGESGEAMAEIQVVAQ